MREIFATYPVVAFLVTGEGGRHDPFGRFKNCLLAGSVSGTNLWEVSPCGSYIVGICYEYKDFIERLHSSKPDHFGWPLVQVTEVAFQRVNMPWRPQEKELAPMEWQPALRKEEYLEAIRRILEHLRRGDIYEMNFCMDFVASGVHDPLDVFETMCVRTPAPFSALYKWHHLWLLCSSPERFLCRRGDILVSQPIKGTAPRHEDPKTDRKLATFLARSPKNRRENVMIVDLVRHDLSRVCVPGTVHVSELCGVHSFSHVHQLISTVKGQVRPGISFGDIIHAAFPPGSMTGAPKIKAMELAEMYEPSRRGMYSGCIGYIEGETHLDLNVVIRSLVYNELTGFWSGSVGGAITYWSRPEKEWEECLWKWRGLLSLFGLGNEQGLPLQGRRDAGVV